MASRQMPIGTGEAEQVTEEQQGIENITFGEHFENTYLPAAKLTKKPKTVSTEKGYFKNWLKPVIGKIPFKDIYPLHFEKIKQDMLKAKKAPRSIQYCWAIGRQVWNDARLNRIIDRESPTKENWRLLPKFDNKRKRFLSHYDADSFLRIFVPDLSNCII